MDYEESTALKTHQPCPKCGSHDAATYYSDGHRHCFSCEATWRSSDATGRDDNKVYERHERMEQVIENTEKGKIREIPERCLTRETCEKFGVRTLMKEHRIQRHFYPYYSKAGVKKAEKIRVVDTKQFFWSGDNTDLALFGVQCQPTTGRYVCVCEGEIDCLSMWQVLGGRYTCVSIPNGCKASKAIKDNYEYLNNFENIIICFDGDTPGKEGAEKIAQLLPPKKTKVMKFDANYKDPNAMLQAGKIQELINLFYRAEEYMPKDIVNISSMFDRLKDYRRSHKYIATPWAGLNEMLQGTRPGQVVVLAAGSGQGKSAYLKSWMMHLVNTTDVHIGTLYLEETPEETVLSLMSQVAGRNLKRTDVYDSCTPEEIQEYFEKVGAGSRIDLFEPITSTEPEYICNKIRYMAIVRDCRYIVVDHLTYIAESEDDVRRALDKLMNKLHKLAVELGLVILCACHLRKSANSSKTAEEGGKITLADLKDSSSIYQLSDICLALERNSQDPDPVKANTTMIRVLKNRDFGEKGLATAVLYEKDTTRLVEIGLDNLDALGDLE